MLPLSSYRQAKKKARENVPAFFTKPGIVKVLKGKVV